MTKLAEKPEIKSAINRYCKAKQLSKNELATQLDISAATLSNIENENWKNIDQRMWQKIWNKVGKLNDLQIFKTKDYCATENLCHTARTNGLMAGLIADTGMGKTTAITAYAQRTPNTFYVCFDKTMKPRQFFTALLKEMGISFDGNLNEMVNLIASELNESNIPLVIIDEAGKLTHTMLLYLQVLKDKTNLTCGFVLAGMPYFKQHLIKYANKQKEGYAEFYRRVNLWHELEGLNVSESIYICEQHGITDPYQQKQFRSKWKFGDLINALLLERITNQN